MTRAEFTGRWSKLAKLVKSMNDIFDVGGDVCTEDLRWKLTNFEYILHSTSAGINTEYNDWGFLACEVLEECGHGQLSGKSHKRGFERLIHQFKYSYKSAVAIGAQFYNFMGLI